jgi:predicted dehydrogenase
MHSGKRFPPQPQGVTVTDALGVIMNGVTGRMGYRQHLVRSVLAIREQGGVLLADGRRVQLEPVLVGRSAAKLADIAARHGLERWTTNLDEALADDGLSIYFDAQLTSVREESLLAAIAAGKAIYTEKPVASTVEGARKLAEAVEVKRLPNGVVHDKLFLPGLLKLRRLLDAGFFGRLLSVRGEFGYWVFEGDWQSAQRPSWNYRAAEGGGIVSDMFCHWSYILENLFGRVEAVTAKAVTAIPRRVDERGETYDATADDSAYAIFELEGGVIAQINSSWAVRVNREELVEFQVDGVDGSAVAGLRNCRFQHRAGTPLAVWNPDLPDPNDYRAAWQTVPDNGTFDNGFKAQWEQFVRHVVDGEPNPYEIAAAARGVQLAEAALESSASGRRVAL